MLVNEYKLEFYVMKVQKMRNFRNVYIRGSSVVMSRTDAQNVLKHLFVYFKNLQNIWPVLIVRDINNTRICNDMNNTLICTVLLVLRYEKIRLALRLLTAQQKDAGETLVMDDVII